VDCDFPPPAWQYRSFPPDPLALKGRAECQGNIDVGDLYLEPPDFNRFLADLVMSYIGHHMLVGTDAGGQNLGNIGVGQGRETPVDTTGCRRAPLGADFSKSFDKREDPILVVVKNRFIISGLNTAEGHGRPVGKPECKYGR
jgi:hypothetical protein